MLTLLQLQFVLRLEILNSLTLWSRFCGIDGGNRTEGPGGSAPPAAAVHEKHPLNVCTNRGRCAGGGTLSFLSKV